MRVRYSFSSRRTGLIDPTNKHKQAFPKLVLEVVRISDLILEVLDARFIEETRNIQLEGIIKEQGKQLIYVINKVDLADIKKVKEKIEELNLKPHIIISCKSSLGRKRLRDRIKIEIRRMKITHAKAHVGVIGYPNTGKSTLINVLAGGGRSKASAESGFTKGIHKIRFSKDILILDTPGVISYSDSPATQKENPELGKIGVKTYSSLKNPYQLVVQIMQKNSLSLQKFYGIQANGDPELFMEQLGRKRNILKKGNIVDIDRVSRIILKDWQEGKIKQESIG